MIKLKGDARPESNDCQWMIIKIATQAPMHRDVTWIIGLRRSTLV